MKKILFIIIMLCTLQGLSQDTTKYVYCEMSYFVKPGFSGKIIISIDYGKNKLSSITDDTDKMKEFTTMIDALNFMGNKGWEVISNYSEATSVGVTLCRYLLKMKL